MERPTSSASTARRLRTDLLYTLKSSSLYDDPAAKGRPSVSPAAIAGVLARAVGCLELLERSPGTDRHARERGFRQVARHLRLVPKALVEALQQRSSPGQHDAAVHDVRRELRRRAVERLLDCADDLADRFLEGAAHLLGGEHNGLGEPRNEVAA